MQVRRPGKLCAIQSHRCLASLPYPDIAVLGSVYLRPPSDHPKDQLALAPELPPFPAMAGPSEEAPKLDPMEMQAMQASVQAIDNKKHVKGKYAFWETQPVAQFREDIAVKVLQPDAT